MKKKKNYTKKKKKNYAKKPPVVNVTGKKVEIIKDLTKNDNKALVYMDPPYYPVNKNKKGKVSLYKLYNSDYSPLDFLKLKERCDELTRAGIPFVLSNSDSEFVKFLFKDYPIVEVREPRGIKNKEGKSKVMCLIITNFKQKKDFMEGIKELNRRKKEVQDLEEIKKHAGGKWQD